jgi:energy-coupling factor transporter ATP-binding protein EcfA2
VDELPRRVDDGLRLLAMCGLGEARLLLRTPSELSEGQRYRFRLARGVAERPAWVLADEFTATLDRTLAKVVAFGARRLADREGVGFLLATTHEDVIADLAPDVLVRCEEGREPRVEFAGASRDASGCGEAGGRKKKRIVSFADEFTITTGTKRDWPYFAGWHYRGKDLGVTRFITLLWHGEQPAGICVFGGPAISLAARNRYFGLSGRWTRLGLQTLNRQLVTLSRVVLHPTYRGAGLGAEFVRRSCRACPFAWIETLAEMGHLNPVFERAGFERVGTSSPRRATREGHSALWGTKSADGKKRLLLPGSHQRSQWAEPVYYVFDNRKGGGRG